MRLRHLLLAAVLAFGGCTSPSHSAPAEAPGMVSAADPRAAAAGVEILRQGGSGLPERPPASFAQRDFSDGRVTVVFETMIAAMP